MTDDNIDDVDRAALERAVALTLAEDDPARVAQVQLMLAEDPWLEAASFCAYHRQFRSLNLKPWQHPPCTVDADGASDASRLLRKMLAHDISPWDPDPIAALAAKKARA